jgi:hypothetical protein
MALRHEVVDGGYLIRTTLCLGAAGSATDLASTRCGCTCAKFVRALRVTLSPGPDAAFIEARHPFESDSEEGLLRIAVGALRAGDSADVVVDTVIPRTAATRRLARVAHVTVSARVWDGASRYDLCTIQLPVTFCTRAGAASAPQVVFTGLLPDVS